MKKSELQTGDVIKLRNGEYYLLVLSNVCSDEYGVFYMLDSYDENLKHYYHHDHDIIKVLSYPKIYKELCETFGVSRLYNFNKFVSTCIKCIVSKYNNNTISIF